MADLDFHRLDPDEHPRDDMEERRIGFGGVDEAEDPLRLQGHQRLHPHDRAHVDLTQDEYTPEEVARLFGLTVEAVLHDIRAGLLKADRAGHDVICVKRTAIVEWLNARGGV